MSNKTNVSNLKEKLKQALESTVRVISEDFDVKMKIKITKVQKNLIFLN